MSIFILEDDVVQAQSLQTQLASICQQQHIAYDNIVVTSKADEILTHIPHCSYTPIYFLDIEIKQDTRKGLDVAREIRKRDSQGIIVFITTHAELAPISYQYMVSALTFIDKNAPLEQRQRVLTDCLVHYKERNGHIAADDYFIVENAYTTVKVPFASVEYVMTDEPHRLQLVTTEQFIQFYGALKDIEQLDTRLLRCHKSYVVNTMQLQAFHVKQQRVQLKSGANIPVSRRMVTTIKTLLKGEA